MGSSGSKPYKVVQEKEIENAPLSVPLKSLNLISNQSANNILKIVNQKNSLIIFEFVELIKNLVHSRSMCKRMESVFRYLINEIKKPMYSSDFKKKMLDLILCLSYENSNITLNLDDEKFNNIEDNQIKEIENDLINKIVEKGYNLPIDNFLSELSKTIFVKNPEGEFALGSYTAEDHTFLYIPGDVETIRHELLHMLLPDLKNSSLNEGLVQIFLHDLFDYEIKGNIFDASLCKIFIRLLSSDELEILILGNKEVLENKLASIKPSKSDAEQFLIYANNAEYYYRLFNESYFNNNEEQFKASKEYTYVKEYRKVVKERIKIYLYNYYINMDFECTPYERLVEIFEILNLVNYNMYDPDLEEENEKDYFLKPIVDEICIKYNIDQETLQKADKEAMGYLSFKYLNKLNFTLEKTK